jgi:hypothetical protein
MHLLGIQSFGKGNITRDGFDLEHAEWPIFGMLHFVRQRQRTRHTFQHGWAILI